MTRSELVSRLAKRQPHLLPRDVELAVHCILEQMAQTLEAGGRVEVRDFGAFSLHQRSARIARNPKTGEPVNQPATVSVHFKPGKELKDRVDTARNQYDIKE